MIWYVVNQMSCWYLVWFFTVVKTGTVHLSSFWMILLWLIFDVWGAIVGEGNIGYWAHLSGLAAGIGLATVLLSTRMVQMEEGEKSLYQVFSEV